MALNESNSNVSKRAIVVGATGATGRQVVKKLLLRNWEVITVTRRLFDYEITEEEVVDLKSKLIQIQSDFTDVDNLIEKWKGSDALFNCIG